VETISASIQSQNDCDVFSQEGTYEYTTRHSANYYHFEIVKQRSGIYRIYIVQQPSYNGRSTGDHDTHRIYDSSRSLNYICVKSDKQPTSVSDATTWLIMWAEGTDHYIKHGSWDV